MIAHLPALPVVLPALIGAAMVLAVRHDLIAQRVFAVAAMAAMLGLAAAIAALPGPAVYRMGDWPAPFGIVLQADRLAGLMLVLTAVLGLAVTLYAIGTDWDRRGAHFHPLMMFQMMGLNGAFLTGDAFNLFVFFEVMLIASYGLMIHGGGAARVRAGLQYLTVNLAGSALFLFALGTLYAVTGTLNMADLGIRATAMTAGEVPVADGLLRVGAVMMMTVFAIKAALVPFQFWLPGTYRNAPGPVAALFAIMTKVGVYAMLRALTLIFPSDTGAGAMLAEGLRLGGGLTLILGAWGIFGARDLGRMVSWAVVASVGTLMLVLSAGTAQAVAAGLYYLVPSTLASAALFLLADMIEARRGGLALTPGARLAQGGLIAAMAMAAMVAITGMPPLAGFLGKLAILQALPGQWGVWAVVLVTSWLSIMGFARAGALLFWAGRAGGEPEREPGPQVLALVAIGLLLAAIAGWTVAAEPILDWLTGAAAAITDPAILRRAVLG